jgi:hypothetical protein
MDHQPSFNKSKNATLEASAVRRRHIAIEYRWGFWHDGDKTRPKTYLRLVGKANGHVCSERQVSRVWDKDYKCGLNAFVGHETAQCYLGIIVLIFFSRSASLHVDHLFEMFIDISRLDFIRQMRMSNYKIHLKDGNQTSGNRNSNLSFFGLFYAFLLSADRYKCI